MSAQEREPLLLVHGFTDTARTWDALVPLLRDEHELIVPTLLGHSGGPPILPGMTSAREAMVDDLERVLDEAGAPTAHVVGNSLGGWLAFELAARGRARSVVALSPGGGWEHGSRAAKRTMRQFERTHAMGGLGARYADVIAARPGLRKLALRDVLAHPERVHPSTAAALIRGSVDCPMYAHWRTAVQDGKFRTELEGIDVRVRIAWGTKDRTLPRKDHGGFFHTMLPDAEWIELPDAGHLPQLDDPRLVARTILEVTRRR